MLITTSLAAAALATSLAGAASPASTLPPLVVSVTDMADMPVTLVPRVLDEANTVWSAAGVTFVWRRVSPQSATRMDLAPAATTPLRIVISNARGTSHDGNTPLGWITFDDDDPAQEIYISYPNAVAYLEGAQGIVGRVGGMTIREREIYLSRAMGRALAHELGHYLLASKVHTRKGLMQATHSATDFFDPQRRAFGIAAEQRQLIAARLHQDRIVVSR
jgi:hypothetical protein